VVYRKQLVACVKVNGQILRETDDTVTIPFGSEYSILLKNLNSVRVQVKVSVDGTDATEGTWLVIQPNSSLELERFIRNGNLQAGNRFKFIHRSKEIEKHRGLKSDDGLIRIEYMTEKVTRTEDVTVRRHYYDDYHYWPTIYPHYPWPYKYWWDYPYNPNVVYTSTLGSVETSGNISSANCGSNNVDVNCSVGAAGLSSSNFTSHVNNNSSFSGQGVMKSASARSLRSSQKNEVRESPIDDSGITVPGSESFQQFHHTGAFLVHEQSEVIVLRLRGEVGGKVVAKAVTVKSKPRCTSCGKSNRGSSKYCASCGTALEII
jgi:hypothetical protein